MSHQKNRQCKIKLLILGDPGVGKTAFAVRYLTKRFIGDYDANKEMLYTCKATIEREECIVELLDTAHEDTSSRSFESLIKWADGYILMYSVIDQASFRKAAQIHTKIIKLSKSDGHVPIVLVANKTDLLFARHVSETAGSDTSKELSCPVIEISVADSYDLVAKVIDEISRQVKRDREQENAEKSVLSSVRKALKKKMYRSKSDTV